MHAFRLWLGLTLFFVYGFAIFIPDSSVFMFVSPKHHWQAMLELLSAGVIAWQFLRIANVGYRMPPEQPGMGLITLGLIAAAVGIVIDIGLSSFSDERTAFFLSLAMSSKLELLQVAFMVLVTLGALRVILTLEPLDADEEAGEQPAPGPAGTAAIAAAPISYAPPDIANASTALRAAQDKVARQPHDLVAHAGLHSLLAKDPDATPMLEHARVYIAALLRQARAEQAYELLRKCLAQDANFKPHADTVLPLARYSLQLKDPKTALRVLNGFSKANPGHADTPHILFQSARALLETGGGEMAKKFLEALLARYPEHALAREARQMLETLNSSQPG
jgi:tetratricopeptide (TPR) repeat protein